MTQQIEIVDALPGSVKNRPQYSYEALVKESV